MKEINDRNKEINGRDKELDKWKGNNDSAQTIPKWKLKEIMECNKRNKE